MIAGDFREEDPFVFESEILTDDEVWVEYTFVFENGILIDDDLWVGYPFVENEKYTRSKAGINLLENDERIRADTDFCN